MESFMTNLKKHVSCSICLDTFTKPKTIACLHTFCCDCLEKHARTSSSGGKFRCPECQAEVALPEANRFDKLPTSFHHNSLLSILAIRQVGDGSEISCGICKKTRAEITYCFDCEKLMCSDCKNAHEVFKDAGFQGHKITPVKQFQAQDYETLLKRQSFCSQQYHERELTRFYCTECEMCVCQICIITEHKTHEVEPLEKAADGEKTEILARAETIKEKINNCNASIQEIEESETEMERNVACAKREVSEAADRMVAKIRELERENITALENTRVWRAENFNSAKQQIQSLKKQFNQAVDFADDLVQRCSSSGVMQSKKKFTSRADEIDKTQIPSLPVCSFVKFVPTFDPANLKLGFMATSDVDVNKSKVFGLKQEFQAGVEGTLVVRPKILEKEPVAAVKAKVHVEALIEPAEEIANLIVCDQGDGNYQVKFIPKVPCNLKIFVKINSKDLANSPFTVQVKERLIQVIGELDFQGEVPQRPFMIAVNSKGLIAVTDYDGHCVLIYNKKGKYVRKLGCHGNKPGQFENPTAITFINNDEILVADALNNCIQQFNVKTGNFVRSFGKKGTGAGEFNEITSLCLNDKGNIVVTDKMNERVQVLSEDGKPVFQFGENGPGKLNQPFHCTYYQNTYIVSEFCNDCLKVFDCSGTFQYQIVGSKIKKTKLSSPWGICVEQCQNHQNILVCNFGSGQVYQITTDCYLSVTGWTVKKLKGPMTLTTTPDGRILVGTFEDKKVFVLKEAEKCNETLV
ncbi:E3 ubiquitin-protein ligase TRIM71-like [Montipora foliosa]|uniref:E3 ubiquitin-protein ligase TRIM71-like n=1 Tax=Montipora foliosa TaxID=591990 RepID=UPI0035F1AD46